MLKIIILFLLFNHKCGAWSTGAPLEACTSMLPNHPPFTPMFGSPFINIVISQSTVFPDERLRIVITSTDNVPFRGFLVQAREISQNLTIGEFISNNATNLLNCFGMIRSAATHTNRELKNQVILEWKAPQVNELLIFRFL